MDEFLCQKVLGKAAVTPDARRSTDDGSRETNRNRTDAAVNTATDATVVPLRELVLGSLSRETGRVLEYANRKMGDVGTSMRAVARRESTDGLSRFPGTSTVGLQASCTGDAGHADDGLAEDRSEARTAMPILAASWSRQWSGPLARQGQTSVCENQARRDQVSPRLTTGVGCMAG
jgi:hypothetical protein